MICYNPYCRGRWYKTTIRVINNDMVITSSDIDATMSSNRLKMPKGFKIIDVKYDLNTISSGSVNTITNAIHVNGDGTQAINMPNANVISHGDIFVFGYWMEG